MPKKSKPNSTQTPGIKFNEAPHNKPPEQSPSTWKKDEQPIARGKKRSLRSYFTVLNVLDVIGAIVGLPLLLPVYAILHFAKSFKRAITEYPSMRGTVGMLAILGFAAIAAILVLGPFAPAIASVAALLAPGSVMIPTAIPILGSITVTVSAGLLSTLAAVSLIGMAAGIGAFAAKYGLKAVNYLANRQNDDAISKTNTEKWTPALDNLEKLMGKDNKSQAVQTLQELRTAKNLAVNPQERAGLNAVVKELSKPEPSSNKNLKFDKDTGVLSVKREKAGQEAITYSYTTNSSPSTR